MDMYLNIFDEPEHSQLNKKFNKNAGNSTMVAVALVAIVVVVLGLLYFASQNDTSTDFSAGDDNPNTVIDDTTQSTDDTDSTVTGVPTDAEIAAARSRARNELIAIQSRFEADEDYAEAEASINELEESLANVYASSTGEVRAEWEETKAEFDRYEQALRNSSADAANILAGLILMFEAEVRTDDEN